MNDDPRQLTIWRHDGRDWRALDDEADDGARSSRLTVVTWNVWFGEWERMARWRALMAEVEACRPDVIALQEVTPPMLGLLAGLDWLQASYAVSDLDGSTFDGHYGVWLATRRPVRGMTLRALPSGMGRRLLTVDLGEATVSTVHLESLRQSARARCEQLALIDGWLDASRPRVFVGDMNFDDGAPERDSLSPDWRDGASRGEQAYTIDGAINQMHDALNGSTGHSPKRVRYDRVFVRGADWRVDAVRRLGTRSLPGDMLTFPSDHFGLCAELARVGG